MFIDQAIIQVVGGRGGDGCMSFRREKYIPRGGPDGGDGGDGGSVYCTVDQQLNTLGALSGKHVWKASSGGHGMGKDRHGKNGGDVHVPVPPGTVVYDHERGTLLKDLTDPGQSICVARGGRGGRGNAFFKSATHQAPREFEQGGPPQQRVLRLELKLIADVGLVGLPNAGKSTLLSRISQARPKIADYPFTTLEPQLGIVDLPDYRRLIVADIPGLIAGAHEGAGLGDEFLRHVERTRLLVHLVDMAPLDGDPAENYRTIRNELALHSPALAAKPEIVAANKMDLTGADEALEAFVRDVGAEVHPISAVTGQGLGTLMERLWHKLEEIPT
ncbi:MAG: GTPase ObgE [Planctomycetes bacterium]|nr:GTPase ObgE [Planctomycetota bacterium]